MAHTATDMIRADHRTVERLYQQYQGGNGQVQQQHAVIEQICHELEVHAQLEESMFYPAIQAKMGSTGKDLVKRGPQRAWRNETPHQPIARLQHG